MVFYLNDFTILECFIEFSRNTLIYIFVNQHWQFQPI